MKLITLYCLICLLSFILAFKPSAFSQKVEQKVKQSTKRDYPIKLAIDMPTEEFETVVSNLSRNEILVRTFDGSNIAMWINNKLPEKYDTLPTDTLNPKLQYVCELPDVGCAEAVKAIQEINESNEICSHLMIAKSLAKAIVLHTDCK